MGEYIFIKVIYRDGKVEYYGKRFMQVFPKNNQICEWDKRYAYKNISVANRSIPLLKDKLSSMGIKEGKWRIMTVSTLTCFEDN